MIFISLKPKIDFCDILILGKVSLGNLHKSIHCYKRRRLHRSRYKMKLGASPPEMLLDQIPKTCTMAEKPRNFEEEFRLWVRAYGRISHRYIWSDNFAVNGITRNDFAILVSRLAKENHGRYNILNF